MIGRLKLWFAGAGVVALGLLSIWFGGRKAGKDAANAEELNEYIETRKRMDEVGRMSDADASRAWLRDRNK